MGDVFKQYSTSRFIDHEKVIDLLKGISQRLVASRKEVTAVHLFGSFALGKAVPRSDADIVVEAVDRLGEVEIEARNLFSEAPVPVDLFVRTPAALQSSRGIASRIRREGILLAFR
jgi:predicted nucleotidyltransferase